jgi:acyl-CoA thioesterase-2
MKTADSGFYNLLRPEQVGPLRFCGHSLPLDSPAIFGGQLLAQVLSTAAATLLQPRAAHYLQMSFLAFGDPEAALDFDVAIIRDGRTTSHRNVLVTQSSKTLLSASVSFQENMEGLSHALAMPDVSDPEQLLEHSANELSLSANQDAPFPFRIINCGLANKRSPESRVWAIAREPAPADALLQQMLFAFFSDATILQSALQPHQLDWQSPGIAVATMNHTIWFHRTINVNDWILLHSLSPSTGGGRALSTANAFSRGGSLLASVAQEGILRSSA